MIQYQPGLIEGYLAWTGLTSWDELNTSRDANVSSATREMAAIMSFSELAGIMRAMLADLPVMLGVSALQAMCSLVMASSSTSGELANEIRKWPGVPNGTPGRTATPKSRSRYRQNFSSVSSRSPSGVALPVRVFQLGNA